MLRALVACCFVWSSLVGFSQTQNPSQDTGNQRFAHSTKSSLQYNVSLFPGVGEGGSPQGRVAITKAGVTTITVKNASRSTTYTVEFCPAPAQLYPNCFAVGTVTSNGRGMVDGTVSFPSGSWAGDFQLFLDGTAQYSTSVVSGVSSTYYTTLQLDSTVNGKGTWFQGGQQPPQDPLTRGYVIYTPKQQIRVRLVGANSDTEYSAGQCPLYQGSGCYAVEDGLQFEFETNLRGNLTFTGAPGTDMPEDIFYIDDYATSFGYIGGFLIP